MLLVVGFGVAALTACGSGSSSSSSAGSASVPTTAEQVTPSGSSGPTVAAAAKKIFKQDDTSVRVTTGERFGLRLPEVEGSADVWRVVSDPDTRILEDRGTSFKAEAGAPAGSAGQREFSYRARAAGSTTIIVAHGDAPGAERVTFTVTVA